MPPNGDDCKWYFGDVHLNSTMSRTNAQDWSCWLDGSCWIQICRAVLIYIYIVENLYKNDFAPTARKQLWNMFLDQLKVVRQKIERSCQLYQNCKLTSTDSSCNSQSNLITFRCIYCGTFGVGSFSAPKKPCRGSRREQMMMASCSMQAWKPLPGLGWAWSFTRKPPQLSTTHPMLVMLMFLRMWSWRGWGWWWWWWWWGGWEWGWEWEVSYRTGTNQNFPVYTKSLRSSTLYRCEYS